MPPHTQQRAKPQPLAPLRIIPLPATRNLTQAPSEVLLLGSSMPTHLSFPEIHAKSHLHSITQPFSPYPTPHIPSSTWSPSLTHQGSSQPVPNLPLVLSPQHKDKPWVCCICSHQKKKIISGNPERQLFVTLSLLHIPAMVQDEHSCCHLQAPPVEAVTPSCSSQRCLSSPGPGCWFHPGISTHTDNHLPCPRPQSQIPTLQQGGLQQPHIVLWGEEYWNKRDRIR